MASRGRSPCSAQVPHSRGAARRHRAGLVATGGIFLRISLEILGDFYWRLGLMGILIGFFVGFVGMVGFWLTETSDFSMTTRFKNRGCEKSDQIDGDLAAVVFSDVPPPYPEILPGISTRNSCI